MTTMTRANPHRPVQRNHDILDNLPADEAVLIPLYEAYRRTGEALLGVLNKPRSLAADHLIDMEIDRTHDAMTIIASKLEKLPKINWYWREMYVETMSAYAFSIGENSNQVLNVMAKAAAVPVARQGKR